MPYLQLLYLPFVLCTPLSLHWPYLYRTCAVTTESYLVKLPRRGQIKKIKLFSRLLRGCPLKEVVNVLFVQNGNLGLF